MAYLSRFLVEKIAPIKVAAFKSMDKCFRSCDIGCNGDIVYVAKAEKGGIVRIRVLVHRIAEEKKKVDFITSNS